MNIRSCALVLAVAVLAAQTLHAQEERPRVLYDLKAGVAFESPGGTAYGNATAGLLSAAASREFAKNFALELSGDYFTQIFASSGSCGNNPFNGGCITGVTNKNFNTIGAAVSLVFMDTVAHAPMWDASLGVGYYSVGGAESHSSAGFRLAADRTLTSGKRQKLAINAGVLILPIGNGSPMTIITVGLGLRVW